MNSVDVLGVCRLCLSEEYLENIFKQESLNRCISEYLSIVISLSDGLSHLICASCRTRLYEFRDFRLRCTDVQNLLHGVSSAVVEDGLSLLQSPAKGVKTEPKSDSEYDEPLSREAHGKLKENELLQPLATIKDENEKALTMVTSTKDVKIECQSDSEYDESLSQEGYGQSKENELLQPESIVKAEGEKELSSGSKKVTAKQGQTSAYQRRLYLNQLVKCEDCGKMIFSSRMEGHQNKHKGIRPYNCEYGCENKDFHSRHNLHNHYRNIHRKQQVICDICNKVYQSKTGLQCHKQAVHGDKAYACQICPQRFILPKRLAQHMKSHKPGDENRIHHKCPLCEYISLKRYNITRHMKNHETDKQNREPNLDGDAFVAEEVKIEPDSDAAE